MSSNERMNTNKNIARIVDILFIIATVAGILSVAFLGTILTDPDYLINFSAHEYQVILGALLDLMGAGAFVALAVVIFPVLKKQNEGMALGYVLARGIEAVPFIVANISLLSLLSLSQAYPQTAASEPSNFLPAGAGLMAAYDWAQLLGPRIFASLAALPFYYLLYQSKLIPRWMSVWGLIAAPPYLASGMFAMFGLVDPFSTVGVLLFLPAALLEMVLAVWLIVKGFNPSAMTALSAG